MYIVTEYKTASTGEVVVESIQKSTRPEADAAYYTALANASTRGEYVMHAVTLGTNQGFQIDSKCYSHPAPISMPDFEEPSENGTEVEADEESAE